jgi:transaldolase
MHMQLFIDSSDPKEILCAREWGVIQGVTSNPSLIAKAGPDMRKTLDRILEASPGQVFCQVIGWHDISPMVEQARWLHSYSDKIIVKLPFTVAGLQALQRLKAENRDMPIAMTAIASVAQAYLAAKCGADVAAVFNGPLDQVLDQPVDIVGPIRTIFKNYGFTTKILSCGRFPRGFGEFAEAGTDICTLRFEFLKMLFEHPFTDKRMHGFTDDWRAVFGDATWPKA